MSVTKNKMHKKKKKIRQKDKTHNKITKTAKKKKIYLSIKTNSISMILK